MAIFILWLTASVPFAFATGGLLAAAETGQLP